MRTDETHGTAQRREERPKGKRMPRRTQGEHIGFGQVFQLVRKDSDKHGRKSVAEEAVAVPTALLLDLKTVTAAQPELHLEADAAGGIRAQLARDVDAVHLGAMTPRQAIDRVVSEARKVEIAHAMKELHLELDPAHLGPLVVKIKVDKGRIETTLTAERAAAATTLGQDVDELRERLLALGYSSADVKVEQA